MSNRKTNSSTSKSKKHRFSAVRNFILDVMGGNDKPLAVSDLQELIKKEKVSANKVTLYRELDFLKMNNVIQEVYLGDNKKYYELSSRSHHHHVICVKCKKTNDFIVNENKNLINKALKQAGDFAKITNHSFEFFGVCKSCAS